ncbi:hypothetical protein L917_17766, partial [Phytophthora nicotianae]
LRHRKSVIPTSTSTGHLSLAAPGLCCLQSPASFPPLLAPQKHSLQQRRLAFSLSIPRYRRRCSSVTPPPKMPMTLTRKQRKKFIVRIVLFKCQDLAAADLDMVGGKSDPYVVFTLEGVTRKSSCIMNDLNPQWSPPEKFEFEVDEWENQFLIAQVYDYDRLSKDDLIGSAVIPLALYAGDRHCEMYSYPLVLPDEVGGLGAPKSDLFLQISLTTSDGSPVEYYY